VGARRVAALPGACPWCAPRTRTGLLRGLARCAGCGAPSAAGLRLCGPPGGALGSVLGKKRQRARGGCDFLTDPDFSLAARAGGKGARWKRCSKSRGEPSHQPRSPHRSPLSQSQNALLNSNPPSWLLFWPPSLTFPCPQPPWHPAGFPALDLQTCGTAGPQKQTFVQQFASPLLKYPHRDKLELRTRRLNLLKRPFLKRSSAQHDEGPQPL